MVWAKPFSVFSDWNSKSFKQTNIILDIKKYLYSLQSSYISSIENGYNNYLRE